jgi:UDP-N-acetylglucosamine 2-epimerase (non-hydrolysing)
MTPVRVALIAGTRPEIIKLASVYHELIKVGFNPTLILTSQQTSLTDGLTEWFEITNIYECPIPKEQSLIGKLGEIAKNIEAAFESLDPGVVVVQGDTTSALAGAVTAFYSKIDVVHIEAGLRCETIHLPFPEEANRRLISQISQLNFVPTPLSESNLLKEGFSRETISVVGNTVIDALGFTLRKLEMGPTREHDGATLKILVTVHRRESFGAPLEQICQAINEISAFTGVQIIWPVHSNPAVRDKVSEYLSKGSSLKLIHPLTYPEMVKLLTDVDLVLTDSGGIQEEALGLGIPTLILRTETERPELIESGLGKLIGTKKDYIVSETVDLLNKLVRRGSNLIQNSVLGTGQAAVEISKIMKKYYKI